MLALAHTVAPAAEPLRARQHRRTEVDLLWIAGQLGLTHHAPRTIIAKVRLLAEQSGFPLPKTPRFVAGVRKTGAEAIDARSIWDRDPVERWLEDDRPPAESAALTQLRRNNVAEEMGRRAQGLVLVAANA
jgi:hypothetical protein